MVSQKGLPDFARELFRIFVVHAATLPAGSSIHSDWKISVYFERGRKAVSSQESNFNMMSDGRYEADFDGVSL